MFVLFATHRVRLAFCRTKSSSLWLPAASQYGIIMLLCLLIFSPCCIFFLIISRKVFWWVFWFAHHPWWKIKYVCFTNAVVWLDAKCLIFKAANTLHLSVKVIVLWHCFVEFLILCINNGKKLGTDFIRTSTLV